MLSLAYGSTLGRIAAQSWARGRLSLTGVDLWG